MRILPLLLCLTACAAPQQQEIVKTVEVRVKDPCIDAVPQKPVYKFGKGARPSDAEMARILAADFELAESYGRAWEAAATGCVVIGAGR